MKHFYLVIDTETVGDLKNAYVYDLGGVIIDRQGNIYETFSFVIKEIWNEIELLKTVYYKKKLPSYMEDLLTDERQLIPFKQAQEYLETLNKKYNFKAILAYNALFDYNALKNTQRYLNNEDTFLPKDVEIWDILKMTKDVIATKKSYKKFCEKHNYMTKHKTPRPQVKAEVVYKYITDNTGFVEKHSGLADSTIEKDIFLYCLKQKKSMRRKLFEK